MFPLIPSLISGGASLLGSMFSSQSNADNVAMQEKTNQMSVEENQKNRDFQQQMSNTAYQRSSADMQKAGLNPMMMFGSGGPASTPSGGVPSLNAPKKDVNSGFANIGDAVGKALSSAVQVKTMDKMADEMSNLEVQNTQLRKLTELTGAQTATEQARKGQVEATTANIQQDTTKGKLDRARQEWEAIKYLDLSSVPDAVRKTANIGSWGAGKVSDVLAPLASSAGAVSRLLPKTTSTERSRVDSSGRSFDEFWKSRSGYGN